MQRKLLIYSTLIFASATAVLAEPGSVARSCAAGADCVSLVNAEIAGMEGTAAEKDKAIADLVVAIGTESQTASPDRCNDMAVAVRTSASSVSGADQQTRIISVAETMCTQQTVTAAVGANTDDDGGERNESAASAN